jgi:hypothetical protein
MADAALADRGFGRGRGRGRGGPRGKFFIFILFLLIHLFFHLSVLYTCFLHTPLFLLLVPNGRRL